VKIKLPFKPEMKERPIIFNSENVKAILDGRKTQTRRVVKKPEQYDNIRGCDFCSPYGQVGQRLWVRETWWLPSYLPSDDKAELKSLLVYRAEGDFGSHGWRPSIFMPKWATRIWLEITEVRVERLQEIKFTDCEEEGIKTGYRVEWDAKNDLLRKFEALWDSLNAKRGFGWHTNCWVWVISFRRVNE